MTKVEVLKELWSRLVTTRKGRLALTIGALLLWFGFAFVNYVSWAYVYGPSGWGPALIIGAMLPLVGGMLIWIAVAVIWWILSGDKTGD